MGEELELGATAEEMEQWLADVLVGCTGVSLRGIATVHMQDRERLDLCVRGL